MTRINKNGIGLVEVVIGAAIITFSIAGLVAVFNLYLGKTVNLTDDIKAEFLAKEGVEAFISMRNRGFVNISNITSGEAKYLQFSGNSWATTTQNIYVDGKFERKFVVENVLRDANDNISASGTLDPNSRKITVDVSWLKNEATTTKSLSVYLSNLFGV